MPGCNNRYSCWLQDVFYQGEKIDMPTQTVRQYLRSEHVYEQFSPLAHFNIIWLSNEVRAAYVQIYAQKHCLTQQKYQNLLQNELTLNQQCISFYILAAITTRFAEESLISKNPEWSISLFVNDHYYKPVEIAKLENLPPEYVIFYGKAFTRFKTPYLVKFNMKDPDGVSLINQNTKSLMLLFSTYDRKICLTWCLDRNGSVIYQRFPDPDILAYDYHCF